MIHDNSHQQEIEKEEESIRVGACDWDMAHWPGVFYPQDLPEDWRLSYYANEFSVVLVAESKWSSADFEQWADEVPENFRFYLQCEKNPENIQQLKQTLGESFGGFVSLSEELIDINAGVAVIEFSSKTLREWRLWLEQLELPLKAVFLKDELLTYKELSDFKSLLELMNLS